MSRWAVTDAASFAVAVINEGNNAFLELFKQLGIGSGNFTGRNVRSRLLTLKDFIMQSESPAMSTKVIKRGVGQKKRFFR